LKIGVFFYDIWTRVHSKNHLFSVTGVAYKVPDTLYMYERYDQTMLTQTSEIANRNRCSSLYKSFNTSSYYGKTGPFNLQATHHEKTVSVTSLFRSICMEWQKSILVV